MEAAIELAKTIGITLAEIMDELKVKLNDLVQKESDK